jgi:hypothetical protein
LQTMVEPNTELDRAGVLKIELTSGKASDSSFRDLAGAYSIPSFGFGGSYFEIEADGRFAWSRTTDYTPDFQEFGFLRRDGSEIELIPIPHRGVEANFPRAAKFHLIECGDRSFLLDHSNEYEVRQFCRASLTGELGASARYTHGGYIRISGVAKTEKPLAASPRIPLKIWMKYLAAELNPQTDDGFIRRALETVLAEQPDRLASVTDETEIANDQR